jgi:hypothetical protein
VSDQPVVHRARPVALPALVVAAIGFAGFGAALAVDAERALYSYLAAFAYGLSLALGGLLLVMIAHTSDAKWFVVVRRLAEAVASTLPLFALLFVPILVGMERIYPWVPPLARLSPELQAEVAKKQAYLNVPFFVVRAAFYLATWWLFAALLRRWSLRQDAAPGAADLERPVVVSGVGLVAVGFTLTFAAFDWLMSLSPEWISTVFGVYVFAGGLLGALALMAILARLFEVRGGLSGKLAASHYHALGRLTLTFVIFWAYIAYAQGFLIWIADVPREASWYMARWNHGWFVVLVVLVAGQFAIPFFLLLSRPLKRNGAALAAVGGWLLAMHYVDVFWLVIPALRHARPGPHWVDAATLMAVVGSAVAFGAWRMRGHAVVPSGDPRLGASLRYTNV